MKRVLTVVVVALVMAALIVVTVAPAFAKIEPVKRNGGGNTPNGQANGVPTVNENPAGHAPPGHN